MTKTIFAIAAVILSVASASAQTVTTSTVRHEGNRITTTDSDGTVSTTTETRGNDGSRIYTHERTEAPGRKLAAIIRDLPPDRSSRRQRNGNWTGRQGSPRDVAWMESCRPTLKTDRHGMARYVYAKPGCETGEPQ